MRWTGRIEPAEDDGASLVAADVMCWPSDAPPQSATLRRPFYVSPAKGSEPVRVDPGDARVDEANEERARGKWSELRERELGKLVRDREPGPDEEVSLVAQVLRAGDTVEVDGEIAEQRFHEAPAGFRDSAGRDVAAVRARRMALRARHRRPLRSAIPLSAAAGRLLWAAPVALAGVLLLLVARTGWSVPLALAQLAAALAVAALTLTAQRFLSQPIEADGRAVWPKLWEHWTRVLPRFRTPDETHIPDDHGANRRGLLGYLAGIWTAALPALGVVLTTVLHPSGSSAGGTGPVPVVLGEVAGLGGALFCLAALAACRAGDRDAKRLSERLLRPASDGGPREGTLDDGARPPLEMTGRMSRSRLSRTRIESRCSDVLTQVVLHSPENGPTSVPTGGLLWATTEHEGGAGHVRDFVSPGARALLWMPEPSGSTSPSPGHATATEPAVLFASGGRDPRQVLQARLARYRRDLALYGALGLAQLGVAVALASL